MFCNSSFYSRTDNSITRYTFSKNVFRIRLAIGISYTRACQSMVKEQFNLWLFESWKLESGFFTMDWFFGLWIFLGIVELPILPKMGLWYSLCKFLLYFWDAVAWLSRIYSIFLRTSDIILFYNWIFISKWW